MTKRISSKHKIDRRLKINYGVDPRAHSIKETMDQDNTVRVEKANLLIMVFSYRQNKN